jgi:hypothetical protein
MLRDYVVDKREESCWGAAAKAPQRPTSATHRAGSRKETPLETAVKEHVEPTACFLGVNAAGRKNLKDTSPSRESRVADGRSQRSYSCASPG